MSTAMKALSDQFVQMKKNLSLKVFVPDKKTPTLWHISFKGPADSQFQDGIYHAELDLTSYPQAAPHVRMITASGAYQPNTDICLVGITHYHQEGWTPGTSIESVITALCTYMQLTTDRGGIGVIGALDPIQIKKHAQDSQKFTCKCGANHTEILK